MLIVGEVGGGGHQFVRLEWGVVGSQRGDQGVVGWVSVRLLATPGKPAKGKQQTQ